MSHTSDKDDLSHTPETRESFIYDEVHNCYRRAPKVYEVRSTAGGFKQLHYCTECGQLYDPKEKLQICAAKLAKLTVL